MPHILRSKSDMEPPLSRDAEDSAPSTASTPSSPPRHTGRRRITAAQTDCCRTCRLRKVKCSGNPGSGPCSNCLRLELSCTFISSLGSADVERLSRTTPSHSHTEAGTLRKRAQRACSQCHLHKTKCSNGLPKCKRCLDGGLVCEYTPARRKFANLRPQRFELEGPSSSTSSLADLNGAIGPISSKGGSGADAAAMYPLLDVSVLVAEQLLMRKDIILTHWDAYMRYLYWLPCLSFLHPERTYQDIQESRLPPAQAAALCSLCSFFVSHGQAAREFGQRCSIIVESRIHQNISGLTQEALVLLSLNIVYHLMARSFAKVWQYFGVASRLMIGLQLNWDTALPNSSFVQQESIRRMAWHLFNLDRLLAGGYDEYICCRTENMKIRLPCNEDAFRSNQHVVTERLHEGLGRFSDNVGLHGIQLRLVDLRHRIQVVTKKLTGPHGGNAESSKIMADMNSLQQELTRLHGSIPDDLRLSDQSISRYAKSEQWIGYVYFHTHMAICHMDLYAFTLPGHRDPATIEILRKLPKDFLAQSQKQAVAHSLCLARFIDAVRNETDKIAMVGKLYLVGDYSISYMAKQCIHILLIALQYNLYQDITEHTTAPLWRHASTDEKKIRAYITTILEVTEPWSHALSAAREAYESSMIAVAHFDKYRKASVVPRRPFEYPRPSGPQSPGGLGRLTRGGGHKAVAKFGEMPISDWWMAAPATKQASSTPDALSAQTATPLAMVKGSVNAGHGPPGMPHFLAQARGSSLQMIDLAENRGLVVTDGMSWPSAPSELDSAMPDTHQLIQQPAHAVGEDLAMMRIDGGSSDQGGYTETLMAPQQESGMFVRSYAGGYGAGQADTSTYLHQDGFA